MYFNIGSLTDRNGDGHVSGMVSTMPFTMGGMPTGPYLKFSASVPSDGILHGSLVDRGVVRTMTKEEALNFAVELSKHIWP